MAVMQEEIFGPMLPLVPYDTLDAGDRLRRRARPLRWRCTCSSRTAREQTRCSRGRIAGGVSVNDTLFHIAQHDLPFGGVGASGMGDYHGESGFRTFSHMKPVFRQARLNGVGLLNPPYGARFRRMLALLLKRG